MSASKPEQGNCFDCLPEALGNCVHVWKTEVNTAEPLWVHLKQRNGPWRCKYCGKIVSMGYDIVAATDPAMLIGATKIRDEHFAKKGVDSKLTEPAVIKKMVSGKIIEVCAKHNAPIK